MPMQKTQQINTIIVMFFPPPKRIADSGSEKLQETQVYIFWNTYKQMKARMIWELKLLDIQKGAWEFQGAGYPWRNKEILLSIWYKIVQII